MKIGVVILNYNSAKDTEKCLKFLRLQKFGMRNVVLGVRNEELRFIVSKGNTNLLYKC